MDSLTQISMKEIVRKTAELQINGVRSQINAWKNVVSKLPPFLKNELVRYTLQIVTVYLQENKMLGRSTTLHNIFDRRSTRNIHTSKDIETFCKLTRAMSFTILEILKK